MAETDIETEPTFPGDPRPAQPAPSPAPQNQAPAGEPLPPVEPPSAGFLVQLFLIPAVIVGLIVLVWGALSWVTLSGGDDPEKIVQNLRRDTPLAWQTAETLAELLNNDRDNKLRNDPKLSAELAQILDERIAAAKMDEYPVKLRTYLCVALGLFNTPEGLPTLIKAATTDRDSAELPVREAAIDAMGNLALRIPEAVAKSPSAGEMRDTILRLSHDPEAYIRLRAAYVLGVLGGRQALERLNVMMLGDSDRDVSYNAAAGLARQGDARSIQTLIEMLAPDQSASLNKEEKGADLRESKRQLIAAAALDAIAQLAATNHGDNLHRLDRPIAKMLKDPDLQLRGEAERARDALAARGKPAEAPAGK